MPAIFPITIASVASNGDLGDATSYAPDISADGRYVVFLSRATNLVVGDTNDAVDMFVRDLENGTTRRINLTNTDDLPNDTIGNPTISADGHYITFRSYATNLVDGDTNDEADLFVHNVQSGVTRRVNVASDGTQANDYSSSVSISDDGRYVVFQSTATNLVDGDNNGDWDNTYVHDLQTGTTRRVNDASDGSQANGNTYSSSISADGRYVFFESHATNLIDGDTNDAGDIFRHDLETGITSRISVASDGTQADRSSNQHSISADGRYVAFLSYASNLVEGDDVGSEDIFVRDLESGTTRCISLAYNGDAANGGFFNPSISADGRYVVFESYASNLVEGDNNGESDLFVHDLQSGITYRLDGIFSNGFGYTPSISADGRYISFATYTTDEDFFSTTAHSEVMVYDFLGGATLNGTSGDDVIHATLGDDVLNGFDGADTIIGGAGDDVMTGGTSTADLRDVMYGGDGNDTMDGGYGNDELRGDAGDDTMAGGFGADTLIGGAGNDVMTGSAFGDLLFGGDGMDFVNGGWGHDRVNGGADADRFFHVGIFDHGSDWIQDYDATEGDVLLFGNASAGVDDFQVNFAHTATPEGERSGDDNVEEAFVIYRPTGQIMWALVDGGGQDEINIVIDGTTYDLLG